MSREAEATPGLQELARVLTIQRQVLNGADDLCMHDSDHAHTNTHVVWRGNDGAVRGAGEGRGKKDGEKKTRKVSRNKKKE